MVIEGATDAAVFRAYVKHVLVPVLRRGQIVVLDNLSSHKCAEVRCTEELDRAVADGLEKITPQDAKGWFESCGYRYGKG